MFKSLFEIILLCVSMSIDNFLVGLNIPNIPILGITLISFMNAFITFITMFFGVTILKIIPLSISTKLASFIFLYLSYKEISKSDTKVSNIENIDNIDMTFSFIFILGIGLCFTNFSGGIAAGIAKFPIFKTSFICFIITFIFMKSGQILGNVVKKIVNLNLSLFSTICFFFIALKIGYV